MRWSYKTVYFEMKKEGLLGGAFLDESEVELSLNEYGKAGWELVSMLETLDGLIAVFKQPIDLGGEASYLSSDDAEDQYVPLHYHQRGDEKRRPWPEGGGEDIPAGGGGSATVPVDEDAVAVNRQKQEEQQAAPAGDEVGSIRIE